MTNYDLEERTFQLAKNVRIFVQKLNPSISIIQDGKQVIRSSGSIGANYIEANEGVSQKDFLHRIKISRKEAKETIYWLRLIRDANKLKDEEKLDALIDECDQIKKILSSIINKFEKN